MSELMFELVFGKDDLTPKQREVLSQLLAFVTENTYPPSIQQLCQLCGVSSTSTIHFHLSALKKKGLIDWNPAEKRAISIREDLRDAYRDFLRSESNPESSNTIESDEPLQSYGKPSRTGGGRIEKK